MGAKIGEVEIKLGFNADISQAKKKMQELQNQLQSMSVTSIIDSKSLSQETTQASSDLLRLSSQLKTAFNVDTGKINLTKLTTEWQHSGDSVDKYIEKIRGVYGENSKVEESFLDMISSGTTGMYTLTNAANEFYKQLKRTVGLQLSYTVLNQFTGFFSDAYNYAQKLDKALNDIRIVTGKSADEMADFAKEANTAAKSLSTSTEEYAEGSLIFYQQGLSDKEVKERTDITMKLANTSGEEAEQISSYLTSIWNNFDDGSKSLESYADKLSYLGAVSAASNADIAEGMQDFAATASTVGLSYDYAAAALTTLVDKTQQSADTIGNSLKTIFARLSSVSQGETLEDGVNLTKYTQALANVGVNVLDANGQLKDMDVILDDLAEKWQAIDDTQKDALAQTVGGVRQYNNLISLMDNYDTFQEYVSGEANASGYLQEQQEIYAESWEAAANRVTAAFESLYDTIIDDKFFKGLANTTAGIVEGIDNFIQKLGGLKGVLLTVVNLAVRLFSGTIKQALTDLSTVAKNNWNALFGGDQETQSNAKKLKEELAERITRTNDISNAHVKVAEAINLEIDKTKQLTEAEKEYINMLKQRLSIFDNSMMNYNERRIGWEEIETSAKNRNNAQDRYDQLEKLQAELGNTKGRSNYKKIKQEVVDITGEDFSGSGKKNINSAIDKAKNVEQEKILKAQAEINNKTKELGITIEQNQKKTTKATSKAQKEIKDTGKTVEDLQAKANDAAEDNQDKTAEQSANLDATLVQYAKDIKTVGTSWQQSVINVTNIVTAFGSLASTTSQLTEDVKNGEYSLGNLASVAISLVNIISNSGLKNVLEPIAAKIKNITAASIEDLAVEQAKQIIKEKGIQLTKAQSDAINKARTLEEVKAVEAEGVVEAAEAGKQAAMVQTKAVLDATTLGITLIISGIIALGSTFYSIWKNNTLTAQIDKASESAEKAEESFNNLKSTFDDYDNLVSSLKDVDEVTAEWKQTIIETNEELLDTLSEVTSLEELIQNGDLYYDAETQQWKLNPNTEETIEEEANKNVIWSKSNTEALEAIQNENLISIIQGVKELGANAPSEYRILLDRLKQALKSENISQTQYDTATDALSGYKLNRSSEYLDNAIAGLENKYGSPSYDLATNLVSLYNGGNIDKSLLGEKYLSALGSYDASKLSTIASSKDQEKLNKLIEEVFTSQSEDYWKETAEDIEKSGKNYNTQELSETETRSSKWTDDQVENVTNIKNALKEINPALEDDDEMLKRLSYDIEGFSVGWSDLNKNIDDYKKAIKSGAEGTAEYEEAITGTQDALANMYSIDNTEWLDREFIADNIDNIATDTEASWDKVQQNLFIKATGFTDDVATEAINTVQKIQNANYTAGQEVNDEYTQDLIKILEAADLTADELEDLFQALNLEAKVKVEAFDPTTGKLLAGVSLSDAIEALYSKGDNGTLLKSAKTSSSSETKKELERYYRIKKIVEKLEDAIDDLADAEDRAFGKDKVEAMNNEIAAYENLYQVQQQYYDAIQSNLANERAQLESMGLQFDENGVPINPEQWYYDNSTNDTAMKWWDKWEEDDELSEEVEDKLTEIKNNIYDKGLTRLTYIAEFKIEVDDYNLKVLEFLNEQLDDAATDTAESFKNLSKQVERYNSQYATYKQEVIDILNLASDGEGTQYLARIMAGEDLDTIANELNLTNDARKELYDAAEKMMDSATSMKEVWQNLLESIDSFFDAWQEKFDNLIDKVTHLTTVSNKLKDIVNLIGKDTLGIDNATLARIDQTNSAAAITSNNISKTELENAKKAMEEARANGWDTDKEMEEQWNNIVKRYQEAEESYYESVYNMAETFQTQFTDAINDVIEQWESSMSGIYDNLTDLQDAFDRNNDLDDQYLETYEQAYSVKKLLRDINKSINDSDVLKNRQQLSSLYDEINAKQETGVKLSQYQVDAYQKEYDMMIALQALEDAQNAKSTVRMQRDSEGNIGYVYTADQDAIDEAQSNYDDAAYAFAQLNENRVTDLESSLMSLWQDYSKKLQEAADEHRTLTDDEISYFEEKYAYLTSQMEVAFNNNTKLIGITSLDYWNLTQDFNQTVLSHTTGYKTLEDMASNYESSIKTAAQGVSNAVSTYNDQISSYVNITTDQINGYLDDVEVELEETGDTAEELQDEYEEELSNMVDATEEFRLEWEETIQRVIEDAAETAEALGNLGDAYAAQVASAESLTIANQNLADSYRDLYEAMSSGGNYTSTNNKEQEEEKTSTIEIRGGNGNTQKHTLVSTGTATNLGQTVTYFQIDGTGAKYIGSKTKTGTYQSKTNADTTGYYFDKYVKAALDSYGLETGGYTGEWGTDGRVALLHQKELVLNADDTENFLSAMNIVRDVADLINLKDYGANANLSSSTIGELGNFNQNVTITADFPNATDREQIGLAFDDLLNRAAQMMNQK